MNNLRKAENRISFHLSSTNFKILLDLQPNSVENSSSLCKRHWTEATEAFPLRFQLFHFCVSCLKVSNQLKICCQIIASSSSTTGSRLVGFLLQRKRVPQLFRNKFQHSRTRWQKPGLTNENILSWPAIQAGGLPARPKPSPRPSPGYPMHQILHQIHALPLRKLPNNPRIRQMCARSPVSHFQTSLSSSCPSFAG